MTAEPPSAARKAGSAAFSHVQVPRTLTRKMSSQASSVTSSSGTPEVENPEYPPLRITAAQVERLEQEIDRINANLAPLKSFILPGGSPAAAHLHLARTVARRAEREITALAENDDINPEAIRHINRLSDLLWILARVEN